jgi:YD repeat-containing protein
MRILRIVTVSILAVKALTFDVDACGIQWLLPKDHFDGVNEYGYVSYWEKIGELDLQDGLKFPLIIGFESNRETSSPYLGHGWILTLLDSRIVQINEREFQMILPDGYILSFGRDSKNPNLLNGQAGWKAEVKTDSITAYADCGWKLLFNRGKLAAITTPKNRVLEFVINNGRVSEIREGQSTLLRVETDPATGAVSGLSYGSRHIAIELGERPQVQSIKGNNVISGMQLSLRQIVSPEGKRTTYEFAIDDKRQPTLAISGGASRHFTWDPASKRILKDGMWTYDITPSTVAWENAAIDRKNKQGLREYWFLESSKGVETVQSIDGVRTITTSFVSGRLAGAIRKVTASKGGVVSTVYQAFYDEKDRLIRETTPTKRTDYRFDQSGRQLTKLEDGIVTLTETRDDQGRLLSQNWGDGRQFTFQYDPEGGYKKTVSLGNYVSTVLYGANGIPLQSSDNAGRTTVFRRDPSGSSELKGVVE